MESPGKFDSRTLSRKTLIRWTGRIPIIIIIVVIVIIIIITISSIGIMVAINNNHMMMMMISIIIIIIIIIIYYWVDLTQVSKRGDPKRGIRKTNNF